MLFKLIFTLLGILWLVQALRPYFRVQQEAPPPEKKRFERSDDYIDYEEIK